MRNNSVRLKRALYAANHPVPDAQAANIGSDAFDRSETEALASELFDAAANYALVSMKDRDIPGMERLPVNRRIGLCRSVLGMTQEELATRLRIDQSEVSKCESPDKVPSIESMKRICDFLGVTLTVGEKEAIWKRCRGGIARPKRSRSSKTASGSKSRSPISP